MPNCCQNLSFKGGESGQNIPRVVGGITKKGESCQRDCYIGLFVRSNQENKPSLVVRPTSIKLFSNASDLEDGGHRAVCFSSPIFSQEKPYLRVP